MPTQYRALVNTQLRYNGNSNLYLPRGTSVIVTQAPLPLPRDSGGYAVRAPVLR
jgi:hypothetical protein